MKSSSPSAGERILEQVFLAVLLVAVPYAAGFFYLNSYYGFFGISIAELNLTDSEIFVAAIAALMKAFLQSGVLILSIVTLFLVYLILRYGVGLKLKRSLSGTEFAAIIFLLVVGSCIYAARTGKEAARTTFGTFRYMLFVREDQLPTPFVSVEQLSEVQDLSRENDRLIFANEHTYFLLRQEGVGSRPITIRLPRADDLISFSPMLEGTDDN